uniref:replication helicase subunit n=1 Tax=Goniotrichopsis reniformis TaxID=468933 RepID=UPI001FCE04B3|nr:replication helicase subunit [Goniotrichopsis reniformis]UNJ14820.1 replication helicase subunit [Goniotrichopsis reniformis]
MAKDRFSQESNPSKNSEEYFLYNPYAEDLILTSILSNKHLASYIFSEIDEKLFYILTNKIIFQSMQNIYIKEKTINSINIIDNLQEYQLAHITLAKNKIKFLTSKNIPISIEEINGIITILKNKFIKRNLFNLSLEINNIALGKIDYDIQQLDKIQNRLSETIKINSKTSLTQVKDLLPNLLEKMRQKQTYSNAKFNINTGFINLDYHLNELEKGNLIIIAGRPSIGKTAFSLSIMLNICRSKPNMTIVFFSLEMSEIQIMNRLMSIDSGLPLSRLNELEVYNAQPEILENCFPSLYQSSIYIIDNNPIKITDIINKLQIIYDKHKEIDLVIIDYLQLLGDSRDNRAQEIGKITRELKKLARQFDVPIITLSQLNRNPEQRSNKKPLLSDLRESGCLHKETFIHCKSFESTQHISRLPKDFYDYIPSLDINLNYIKFSLLKQFSSNATKHLYQFYLNNQSYLIATANHKLLTLHGWKRIDLLNKFDRIASFIPKKHNLQFVALKKDIQYISKDYIWDLSVPPFKNFFANNIVVHNSIEQDADVVLLLYRNDYYSTNDLSDNSAEIIIAKNRNGSTGNVFLTFIPEITKFEQ